MVILTTAPGLQFYTGNFLGVGGPTMGKQGKPYGHYGGLCLETEGFPDAIHQQTDSMGGGGSRIGTCVCGSYICSRSPR